MKNSKREVEYLKITRNNFLKILNSLSIEQLNHIPKGYKNNIFWNIAHVVVTQQLLVYKLSGLKMYLSDPYINEFKKGAGPTKIYTEDDVQFLKKTLIDLVDVLANDLEKNIFEHYDEYPTSYGVVLNSVTDAIAFNNIHEGLHLGYVMAMKKSI